MTSQLRADIAGCGLLILIVWAVYWPSLHDGFVFDDPALITTSTIIHAGDGLYRIWLTAEAPDYWPVSYTAWWFQWRLFGLHPAGYHAVNIAIHALDVVLIWLVLKRLKVPGAWVAALLFAVHPVNVATVGWISEQKNTLSVFFCALAFLFYLIFDEHDRWKWYAFSLIAFAMALLSKTSIVTAPAVLLGFAWWRRGRINRKDVLRTLPFFALSAAAAIVTIAQQRLVHLQGTEAPPETVFVRLLVACRAVWFYLGKTLLPVNLMMVYPNWAMSASRPADYLPAIGAIVCLIVLWQNRGSWGRGVLFGLGYFAAMLFPVLGFFHQSYHAFSRVADQWEYPAMIGVLALVAAGAAKLWRGFGVRGRYAELAAGAAAVLLLGFAARARTFVFYSEETLWRDNAQRNPAAWLAWNNLGVALAGEGRIDEAIEEYHRALPLKPDYVDAYDNLGNALSAQQKYDEAIANYQRALQIDPDRGDTHEYLAETYWQYGKSQEAIAQWNEALRLEPNSPVVLNNFAWALAVTDPNRGGDPQRAVRMAQYVCKVTDNRDPSYPDTLSVALAAAGEFPGAIATAEKALELARAAGDGDLAGKIESRLKLFHAGQAFYPATRPG
jgi:tetratricopeptide (TPR) repeat protein